jgi:hypothetical protein
MPWLPELFSAPALRQRLDSQRLDELAFAPFFEAAARIYDDVDPPLGPHADSPAG